MRKLYQKFTKQFIQHEYGRFCSFHQQKKLCSVQISVRVWDEMVRPQASAKLSGQFNPLTVRTPEKKIMLRNPDIPVSNGAALSLIIPICGRTCAQLYKGHIIFKTILLIIVFQPHAQQSTPEFVGNSNAICFSVSNIVLVFHNFP